MNTIPHHIVRHIPEAGPIPSKALNETHEEIQSDLIALYQHRDKAIKDLAALWQCLLPFETDIEQQRQIDLVQANLAHLRAGNVNKHTIMEYLSHLCEYGFVSDAGYEPFIDTTHHEVTLPVTQTYSRLVNLDHRYITAIDVDDVLQIDYATLANNASYMVDGDNSHVFVATPLRAYDDETANHADLQITIESNEIANPFNTLQLHSLSPLQIISIETGVEAYSDMVDEGNNPLVNSNGRVFAHTSIFHLKEYTGVQRIRMRFRQCRFIPAFIDGRLVKVFPFVINGLSLLYRQYVTRTDSEPIAHIWFKMPLHQENIDIASPVISAIRHPDVSAPGLQPYIFTLQSNAEDRTQTPAPLGNATSVSHVFVRCDMSFNVNDPSYTYRPVLKGVKVEYEVI